MFLYNFQLIFWLYCYGKLMFLVIITSQNRHWISFFLRVYRWSILNPKPTHWPAQFELNFGQIIFLTMHRFYLPIKLSASYFEKNIVFSIPLIELILPSKCFSIEFLENIPTKFFWKYWRLQILWTINEKKSFLA